MGWFDFLTGSDINKGITEYKGTSGAILLDLRTPQEYTEGHIPGSKNVPLQLIENIEKVTNKKDTPFFVYCYSGARSRQAVSIMKSMGYSNVKNLGGIASYKGKVEK